MEHGPNEAFLVDQARKQRAPIPKTILEAPVLQPGLQFYYSAYLTLASCRSLGFGAEGRVPWTAVAQYADRYGLDEEDLDLLWTLVCELDSCYHKFQQKKGKTVAESKNKPPEPKIVHPPRKSR